MTSGEPTFAFVTQLAGFAGMALNIVMRATTIDRRLKIVGVIAMSVWTLHFVMLRAWAGAACNAIEGRGHAGVALGGARAGRWVLAVLPLVPRRGWSPACTDALPIVSAVACSAAMLATAGIGLRVILLGASVLWLVYDRSRVARRRADGVALARDLARHYRPPVFGTSEPNFVASA